MKSEMKHTVNSIYQIFSDKGYKIRRFTIINKILEMHPNTKYPLSNYETNEVIRALLEGIRLRRTINSEVNSIYWTLVDKDHEISKTTIENKILKMYPNSKYPLSDDQIKEVMRALEKVNRPTTKRKVNIIHRTLADKGYEINRTTIINKISEMYPNTKYRLSDDENNEVVRALEKETKLRKAINTIGFGGFG
jgi:predicted nucleic-acid-binding protein